jgi:hypothetical protein
MSFSRALTPLFALSVLAGCGGRTVLGVESYADDGGADDAAKEASLRDAPPSVDTGIRTTFDTGSPIRVDTGVVAPTCPPLDEVFGIGGACGWVGECSVNLEVCDTGPPTLISCFCVDGVVELPPGEGVACAQSTGPSCPSGVVIGAACTGDVSCETDYCGPGDTVMCSCAQGVWQCPGASCVPPSMPQVCGPGGPCTDGPCLGSDSCGGTVVCTCVDGGESCPVVEC